MPHQDLQTASNRLAEAVKGLARMRRILRVSVVVGALAIVIGTFVVYKLYDVGTDRERERCESTNVTRATMVEAFTFLAETLVPASAPPEVQQRRDEFLAEIEVRFPLEEC